MTVHTTEGAGAPNFAPPSKNAHYLDTASGNFYLAKGTASPSDWVRQFRDVDLEHKQNKLVAGDGITIDVTDPANPVISSSGGGGGGGGGIASIVAGDGISIDDTDPANPVVSATGGEDTGWQETTAMPGLSGTYPVEFRRIGAIVSLRGTYWWDAADDGKDIAQLPNGCRPENAIRGHIVSGNGRVFRVAIGMDGLIQVSQTHTQSGTMASDFLDLTNFTFLVDASGGGGGGGGAVDDTGWLEAVPGSEVAGSYSVFCRRLNGVVHLAGIIQFEDVGDFNKVVAYLPGGCWPDQNGGPFERVIYAGEHTLNLYIGSAEGELVVGTFTSGLPSGLVVSLDGLSYIAAGSGSGSGSGGGAVPAIVPVTESRDLALTDAGNYLVASAETAITLTIPPQSVVAWVANTEIHIEQGAAGAVTIAPGVGVTLQHGESVAPTTREAHSPVTLKRKAENVWVVFGALEAAE